GMVHPDEIYQSLEIAHDLKYGYGLIPWEFQIPTSPEEDGAARSYLFPLLYYYIFELCEALGIPHQIDGSLRVVRIFSATYCTVLIPIVYFFSKELLPPQKHPNTFSLFAAFLTAFWFQFPFFGIRTLTNSFVTPIIFGALFLHLRTTKRKNEYSSLKLLISEFSAGALLGLACALRMDSIVFFVPFFLLRHQNNWRMFVQYFCVAMGFIGMFFIQGLSDLFFFGTFLASPINWFRFNIIEGKSSMFGVQPFFYYFGRIMVQPFYLVNFSFLVSMLIYRIQVTLHKCEGKIRDEWFFATLELFIWFLMSVIIMSFVEHKEERFIFSIFPVIIILFASAMREYYLIIKDFYNYIHDHVLPKFNISRKITQKELASLQLGIFIIASFFTVSSSGASAKNVDWAFFHDVNKALVWVGDQENATGVIMFSHWFYTGGWTHLHKNIPMRFYNEPGGSQRWRTLPIEHPEFNFLVTPHYQYWLAENDWNVSLVQELNLTFRLIETVDGRVDIWFRR
ncbi:MAG: hypothetical protein ACFFDT_23555, partial [Candidatus Hodarchaeota archaeon]